MPCFCCCAATAAAAPAASRASGRMVEGAASLTERALSLGRSNAPAQPAGPSPASSRYASKAAAVREKYATPPRADKKK